MRLILILAAISLYSYSIAQEENKSETNTVEIRQAKQTEIKNEKWTDSIGKIITMTPANFEKMILSSCTILDVRTPEDASKGIIANAVFINIQDVDFSEQIKFLNKSKLVCVYCKDGEKSARASEILAKLGFNVFNLEGGMDAWLAAGKTVENKHRNLFKV